MIKYYTNLCSTKLKKMSYKIFLVSLGLSPLIITAEEKFKDIEVRVIRQKFFQKSFRLETNASFDYLMNKPFVRTLMASGFLGFHINEWLAIAAEGSAGTTLNTSDCDILGTKFNIEPIINELKYWYGGSLVLTPIYGKYQMSSGEVLYFDWFFTFGGGLGAIEYNRSDRCITKTQGNSQNFGIPIVANFPQVNGGIGQRYFINKSVSVNWRLRYMMTQDPKEASLTSGPISNVMLSMGISYFIP